VRARRLFATLALLLFFSWSLAASAEPTAAEKETARDLIGTGREKRRVGQLREALDDFGKAHAIMRVPTTALELGRTQIALGLLVEARVSLLEAVRHAATSGEPEVFKKARREAKALADSLAPRLATLTVTLRGVPPDRERDVKVSVDGADVALASVTGGLRVNPGTHDVVVAIGDQKKRDRIELDEGGTKKLEVAFEGVLAGEGKGETSTGTSTSSSSTRTNPLVYAGIVTAGIGVIVGSATGIAAYVNARDLDLKCPANQCLPPTHAEIDRGRSYGTVSTVAFIVAGVGAALVVVGILNPVSTPVQSAADGFRIAF
jgi:hypothetical protein